MLTNRSDLSVSTPMEENRKPVEKLWQVELSGFSSGQTATKFKGAKRTEMLMNCPNNFKSHGPLSRPIHVART